MADTDQKDKEQTAPQEAESTTPVEATQPTDTTTETPAEAEENPQTEEELSTDAQAESISSSDLRPGMTIRVYQKIKEGAKERTQMFQGIIIAMRGKTSETKTITVQKKSFGVLVDKIFPLASPLIEKIEIVKHARVRRSKLYYLAGYKKKLRETLVKQS